MPSKICSENSQENAHAWVIFQIKLQTFSLYFSSKRTDSGAGIFL